MKNECPFCKIDEGRNVFENEMAFLVYDKFPVTEGHMLVISKSHQACYFDLIEKEQKSMLFLILKAKEIIENKYNPKGFNIGINIGKEAGQTIFHSHIHIIPRYSGDTKNSRGGIRKVIDGKCNY